MRTAGASVEVARPLSSILLSSGHPATSPLAGLHRLVHPPNISYNRLLLTIFKSAQFTLSLMGPSYCLIKFFALCTWTLGESHFGTRNKGNDDLGGFGL